MANYVIQVVISTAGVAQSIAGVKAQVDSIKNAGSAAEDKLKRLKPPADELADRFRDLRRALLSMFALEAISGMIGKVIELSDAYTVLTNKLRTVSDSSDHLNELTEKTFALAQGLRSEWGATAAVYSRIRRSTDALGLSEDQVMKITENLTKAIKVSGATANEAKSVMLQLGQAFGSGKLNGDEFRSAMENASEIGNVLAKSMGVTRGELKALSAAGKITSEVMARAFLEPSESFNKFSDSVPTFAERWTVLMNAATKSVGEWSKNSALLKIIGATLGLVADNMDVVVAAATALGVVLSVALASYAIPYAIKAFQALTAAMLANPWIAAATAIAALITLIAGLAEPLEKADRKVIGLLVATKDFNKMTREMTFEQWSELGRVIEEAEVAANKFKVAITAVFDEIEHRQSLFGQMEQKILDVIEAQRVFKSIQKVSLDTAVPLIQAVTKTNIERVERMIKELKEEAEKTKKARSELNSLLGGVDSDEAGYQKLAQATDVLTEAIRRDWIEAAQAKEVWDQLYESLISVQSVTRAQANAGVTELVQSDIIIDGVTKKLELQNQAFQGAALTLAATQPQRDELLTSMNETTDAAERAARAYQELPGAMRDYVEAIDAASDAYAEGRLHADDYAAALRKIELAQVALQYGSKSLEYGISSGMEAVRDQATDVAGAMEAAFTNAFAGIENAIVDLVVNGKADFKGLVDSMLADLTRVLIRLALTSLLAGDYGKAAAAGGAVGLGAGISALGGLRTGGQFTVGGSGGADSQVVAFRATPGESVRVTTPSQEARGNFGGGQPIIKVFNVYDRHEVSAIDTPAGGRAINNVLRKNPQIIRSRNR